ncbi:N-acetylmuramoyl-L-alanine amidase [Nonomuraea sp. NBC_01738]|uniref:N-acetylmuramoyl-L-alanine amidase n=1 Tax=Nonomuraea sp. NBC_01738 TaxID=2976003 RepID=UPI002E0F86AF|nr:N-acetylmuramoyl-L-alanine amidase [Nonomuraea sp. NBC_01738]
MRKTTTLLLAGLLLLAGQQTATAATSPLSDAFDRAARSYDVPRDLLVSVAYAETHLDGHNGEPSASGGFGLMHLRPEALKQAESLTSAPAGRLRADDTANVLGGAAVLRAKADALGLDAAARRDPARWYAAIAEYGGAKERATAQIYADAVYEVLARGVDTRGVKVRPRSVRPERGEDYAPFAAAATDYPGALWVPASTANYAVSNRPASDPIDRIVIHVVQGSYAGSISWFQNPAAQVSAHYVVRSSDGQITQMVREKDRAWHAGNSDYNHRSVGIEHEGYISDASWFTDQMYRSSAALTRNIADRYGIPKDRSHIIGHVEVPGADHTDPGPYWDWAKYMGYVSGSGNPHTAESVCGSGYKVVDSQALGTAATAYLLYNTANGNNCVAAIKRTQLGTATPLSVFLEVQGATRATDAGNFSYYAGPLYANAPGKCVKWGGSAGSTTYESPFEHCG